MPTWKVPPIEPCDSPTLDGIMATLDVLTPPGTPVEPPDTTSPARASSITGPTLADAQASADVTLDAMPATVSTGG